MKKSTIKITILLAVLVMGVVGVYAYLSSKTRAAEDDVKMTQIQLVLSRDLQKDYPPTVKEVVKYYTDIQKCIYNEACTEEELEQLGLRARELYDAELLANNEEAENLLQLKADAASFRSEEKKITSVSVASSVNVDTFTEDGHEFARIQCKYFMIVDGKSSPTSTVYLLRRDENRRWKIYGWDLAENVNPQ